MKISNLFILLSFILISACGGSSGGSSSNTPPVIQQVPESSARADNTYSSQLRAIDVDGNALTYSIENAPGWLVLDAGSGLLSGFPSKTDYGKHDDIVITVSDGQASTRLSFSLEVLPPPLGRDNFTPLGGVTPTDEGYQATGTLVMTVDGRFC